MHIINPTFEFTAIGKTDSDRYVYNEIHGTEDAYRRAIILPYLYQRVVVEIGAHKGYFTLMAGKLASRVLAFEPDAENHAYLSANVALNMLGDRITVLNQAVSAEEGPKTFSVSTRTAARHTFYASAFSGAGVPKTVECTTLERLMRDHRIDRIGLLKMDCEGSEYDILLNTDPSVFERIDAIALEMHESVSIAHKKEELIAHLEKAGYVADVYDHRSMEPGPIHLWMGWFVRPGHPPQ
jgi:FkbM family methyltransferase